MTLYINTIITDYILIMIARKEETIVFKKVKVNRKQAEKLLITLDKLLIKHKIKPKDIKRIVVADEGGSFTSLRIGVITANALAYAWKIPVQGESGQVLVAKKLGFNLVSPKYQGEPNIGVGKSPL